MKWLAVYLSIFSFTYISTNIKEDCIRIKFHGPHDLDNNWFLPDSCGENAPWHKLVYSQGFDTDLGGNTWSCDHKMKYYRREYIFLNRIPWSFAVFTHLSGFMEGNFVTSSIFIWRFSANGIFGSFSTWALESWIFSLMNSSERFWWSLTEVSFLTMNVNKNKTKRKMTNFLSLH